MLRIFTLLVITGISISCNNDDDTSVKKRQFGIFKVLEDDKTVEMEGEIDTPSFNNFNDLLKTFPGITKVNIKNCSGSNDDAVNLRLSSKVHQSNIETHLLNNGLIASGGVDFFLSGVKRTIGTNTRIGVHSWAEGDGSGNVTATATDYPVGHANHLPYINYYKSIGFTQEESEAFYYFTINAAPHNDVHFMTEAEIVQFKIIKE